MAWNDAIINVSRVTFRRFMMLAEEIYNLNYGMELSGFELKEVTEEIIQNVLDEYIRQHFEESTKSAVKMAMGHKPGYRL
jgi:hypothetical protein